MYRFYSFLMILIPAIVFAEEHGGEHGGPDVMGFVWRLITFIVFAFILYKLLKDPIKNLLVNRTDEIKNLIEEAERAKREAENELNNYKSKLAGMEKELEEMKKRAFEMVEKEKEQILNDAEKNIKKLKRFAENLIESEVTKAKQELKAETVRLAIQLAESKLETTLDKKTKEQLAKEYIKRLEVQN